MKLHLSAASFGPSRSSTSHKALPEMVKEGSNILGHVCEIAMSIRQKLFLMG